MVVAAWGEPVNPWLARRVLAFAHRGGAREGPASTLAAMEAALAAGADVLELDVHASADGALVCCHDDTVDATTDGRGPIAAHALAELERLDAAYSFVPGVGSRPGGPASDYPLRGRAPTDPRYRIPTLEAVISAFPTALLNLDIKAGPPEVPAFEHRLVQLLRTHGRGAETIVASFREDRLARFRAAGPEVATAASPAEIAAFVQAVRQGATPPPSRATCLQIPSTFAGLALVDGELVEAAHMAGLAVHVWTVDDPAEMADLVGLGVDGIMSDLPTALVGVLRSLRSRWVRGAA